MIQTAAERAVCTALYELHAVLNPKWQAVPELLESGVALARVQVLYPCGEREIAALLVQHRFTAPRASRFAREVGTQLKGSLFDLAMDLEGPNFERLNASTSPSVLAASLPLKLALLPDFATTFNNIVWLAWVCANWRTLPEIHHRADEIASRLAEVRVALG